MTYAIKPEGWEADNWTMVSMTPWYRLMVLDAAEKQMASILRLKWWSQFQL
jgi:hypothetical protein